ncbi:MAG: hypothetical protein NC834_00760 [Candidatus Omnitrophica bacterium]|nr:hypothetical protein [Candidatus Omnitrophota bacterium]
MLYKKRIILKFREFLIERGLFFCSLISVFTILGIILVLSFETFEFFKEVPIIKFLTDTQWTPIFINKHFGIFPLLCGTLEYRAIFTCGMTLFVLTFVLNTFSFKLKKHFQEVYE